MGSVLLRGRVGLRGVVHSATGVELLPTTVGLLSAARTAAVASVAGQLLGLEGELQPAPSATLPRTKRPPHGHQGLVLGTLVHSTAADYLRSQEPQLGETIVWKQGPPPWLKLHQAAEVNGVYKVDEVEQVDTGTGWAKECCQSGTRRQLAPLKSVLSCLSAKQVVTKSPTSPILTASF